MNDHPTGNRFDTLAIHAGEAGDRMMAARFASSVSDAALASLPDGGAPSLLSDEEPEVLALEERIAALEGGSAGAAFASGQAALVVALHVLLQPGDEVVVSGGMEAATRIERSFRRFGWGARRVDPEAPQGFIDALSDGTRAILVESVWSGGDGITDLEAVARVAQRARVPLVVDNSWATPFLVRPLDHGADVVLHRADFLAGRSGRHEGGLIVDGGTFDWTGDPRYPAISGRHGAEPAIGEVFGNFAFAVACRLFGGRHGLGLSLAPDAADPIAEGIETLALRMRRHSDNALAVARHLSAHPAVSRLRYAGLDRGASRALAAHYCPKGAGARLSFALGAEARAIDDVLGRLRLFAPAGAASPSRSQVLRRGETVRLSIGLEDAADIIADLDQALR